MKPNDDRVLVRSEMVCEGVKLGKHLEELDHILWQYFRSVHKNPTFGISRMIATVNKMKTTLKAMEYIATED